MAATAGYQGDSSQTIHALTPVSLHRCSTITPHLSSCSIEAVSEQADKTKRKETKTSEKSSKDHTMGAQNMKNAIHQLVRIKNPEAGQELTVGHQMSHQYGFVVTQWEKAYVTPSRGNPSGKRGIDWRGCKAASEVILSNLQKLNVTKVETSLNISFPPPIECSHHCDPDSLGKDNTPCLEKIREGLQKYQKLLTQYAKTTTTTELRTAMTNLLQRLGKVQVESSAPAERMQEWEKELVMNVILQRLQLFAILVARVFSHCDALNI
ncbi:interleukin-23 subunit alpha [Erythrolamprus reginae]|uniref:interleukin-23 subunit alpha n=1 Tax=Erythrolamprus reginae TaxID=121349 RepID=UPI00396C516E